MKEELTAEEMEKAKEYVKHWVKVGLSTTTIDKEKAKLFALDIYKFLGREKMPKEILFARGPTEAWQMIEKLFGERINFVWPYLDGQFWAPYVAWVRYYREVLKIEIKVDTSFIDNLVEFGLIYPLEDVCIFVEKMKVCKTNDRGIHCDGGPAIEYADGNKIWALNGVVVPQWLAETPWNKLDAKQFLNIDNVEVRREFIRKFGVEKLCMDLGSKIIDKQDDYELHVIDLGGNTGKWPCLKMLNPSIGVWHMEWVDKNCKTVKDAIKFRNQSELTPEIVT